MIKAVIFDIDGVLIDSFKTNFKFFQNLFTKTGYHAPTRGEFKDLFYLPMLDVVKIVTKSDSQEEINRVWQIGRKKETGYDANLLVMPNGSTDAVKKLSKNYRLGIVTSRINAFESPHLAKLQNYFSAVITYDDTAKHKPDPEPLLLASKKLGVKPQECVYIGDANVDIIAARAASMKVIIYSIKKIPGADAQTSDFSQLPELIKRLRDFGL